MPDLKIEDIEASLRKSHRQSWIKFLVFLGFILLLWIVTFILTHSKFDSQSKTISSANSIVTIQDTALATRDTIIHHLQQVIEDQKKQIALLTKGNTLNPARLPVQNHDGAGQSSTGNNVITINKELDLVLKQKKIQDSLINLRKNTYQNQEYYPKKEFQQMQQQVKQ